MDAKILTLESNLEEFELDAKDYGSRVAEHARAARMTDERRKVMETGLEKAKSKAIQNAGPSEPQGPGNGGRPGGLRVEGNGECVPVTATSAELQLPCSSRRCCRSLPAV